MEKVWNLMDVTAQLTFLGKIILASLLAGAIGLERERVAKPAGVRTHMVVGAASSALVILSKSTVNYFLDLNIDLIESDPIRIIQSIIIGLGFMGAGTILKQPHNEKIKYLTTAAALLISCAIGSVWQ